jgi:hypothetical protein
MKSLLAVCLLGFSTVALAEVTAADVREANNAMSRACSNGESRECGAAYGRQQAVSNQLHKEMAESLNRGEYGDQRRTRIQEEERWRQEVRNR